MKKRLMAVLLAAALVMALMPAVALAATTPDFSTDSGYFYANGTPITITGNDKGETVITWGDGQSKTYTAEEAAKLWVYGGSKATDKAVTVESSSITMTGGKVYTIQGGGLCTTDKASNVNTAKVTVTGGKVINCVYGGSRTNGMVTSAEVVIGGNADATYAAGGGASGANTGTTKVTIQDSATVDYVYGGGMGLGTTETAVVNINGGTVQEVIGSGSNGTTENTTVNVKGGTVDSVFAVNRGTVVESAAINVTSGNVGGVYAGADPNSEDTSGTLTKSEVYVAPAVETTTFLGTGIDGTGTEVTVTGASDFQPVTGKEGEGTATEMPTNLILGDGVVVNAPLVVPADKTVTVPAGAAVTLNENVTVNGTMANSGTVTLNDATLEVKPDANIEVSAGSNIYTQGDSNVELPDNVDLGGYVGPVPPVYIIPQITIPANEPVVDVPQDVEEPTDEEPTGETPTGETPAEESADDELTEEPDDIIDEELPEEGDTEPEPVPTTGDFAASALPVLLPLLSLAFLTRKKR